MNTDRTVLTDAMWARTRPMLPGKATDPGAARQWAGSFSRQYSGGPAGSPWRDLPESFGNWNSVFKRFRRWALSGIFEQVFNEPPDEFDLEYVFVDGTIVQAHQKAAGAKGGPAGRGSDAPGAA